MTTRPIAFFAMPEEGHFRRLLPLIRGLSGCGAEALVYTHAKFAPEVKREGGIFHDLFSRYDLEEESLPVPCRYVTFAGEHAGSIRRDLEAAGAGLVIHDSFAVVGPVAASLLGRKTVNLCAGHNVVPEVFRAQLADDPRVKIAPRCLRAVDKLRDEHGLADASPFSYVSAPSRDLNLYGEPPEFLDPGERAAFEPIAFYGCLPSVEDVRAEDSGPVGWPGGPGRRRVYISFGTVVWRYFASRALDALRAIASTFADLEEVSAVISLGGAQLSAEARSGLERPNVAVRSYVDQRRVLREADLFVTHHGLNSTHEAIFHRVPMVSYPFFWDQPALAERCRTLGLAVPLRCGPRGEVEVPAVREALERIFSTREAMEAALDRARGWEGAVIRNRPEVHRRIMRLLA